MKLLGLTPGVKASYAASLMRSTSSLPCTLLFWTWREAIEVASRLDAVGRVSLRFNGEQWAVTYQAPLRLINAS